MPHVDHDPNCLFCKIIAKQIPSKTAYEDDKYYAFHDINPGAPTHVLIIPKVHIATLNDLDDNHAELVGGMFLVLKKLAKELGVSERGYRSVFNCLDDAGQSVHHIHLHLLGGRKLGWPPG